MTDHARIRTFIAVELDPAVSRSLADIQRLLRKSGAGVKWVKPDNIHLTLKFLGDVPADKVASITQALRAVTGTMRPFNVTLTGLGVFPEIEQPRIIWAGIGEGKTQVVQLATLVENKLAELQFSKEERPFKAHITIGRVRSHVNRLALIRTIKKVRPAKQLTQAIKRIIIFKSTLTAHGPIYEALERIDLTGT